MVKARFDGIQRRQQAAFVTSFDNFAGLCHSPGKPGNVTGKCSDSRGFGIQKLLKAVETGPGKVMERTFGVIWIR